MVKIPGLIGRFAVTGKGSDSLSGSANADADAAAAAEAGKRNGRRNRSGAQPPAASNETADDTAADDTAADDADDASGDTDTESDNGTATGTATATTDDATGEATDAAGDPKRAEPGYGTEALSGDFQATAKTYRERYGTQGLSYIEQGLTIAQADAADRTRLQAVVAKQAKRIEELSGRLNTVATEGEAEPLPADASDDVTTSDADRTTELSGRSRAEKLAAAGKDATA